MMMCSRVAFTWPFRGSTSAIRSISSPKNSTRIRFSPPWAGLISITSPRTRKQPRFRSMSLRSYWIATRALSTSSLSLFIPGLKETLIPENSSGDPRPKMQDTLATTTTSRRSDRDAVADSRSLSISSLMAESLAI